MWSVINGQTLLVIRSGGGENLVLVSCKILPPTGEKMFTKQICSVLNIKGNELICLFSELLHNFQMYTQDCYKTISAVIIDGF